MVVKRRRSHAPPQISKPTPLLKPITTPTSEGKWTKILLWGLVGTVLIITFVVLLTPLEDPELLSGDDQILPPVDGVAGDEQASGRHTFSSADDLPQPAIRAEIVAALAAARDRLQLPEAPAEFETESLQRELEQLAGFLERQFPDNSAAHHFAAQIWDGLHQTEKAEAAWRTSIQLGTTAPGPYAGLADLLIQTGREQEAVDLLTPQVQRGVDSSDLRLTLAKALENLGQLEAAREALDSAASTLPKDAQWWETYSRISNQLGDYAAAEQSIRRALERGGSTEGRLFLLITSLTRQDKREEAAEVSEQLRELRAEHAVGSRGFQAGYDATLKSIASHAFLSTALVAEEEQLWELAAKYLRRALELDPTDPQILMEMGTFYRRQGKLPEAIVVHQRLVDVQPDNVFNYANLASLWLQIGQPESARALLLSGAQIDPEGVVAQSALARLGLAEGRLYDAKRWAELVLSRNRSVESHVLLATIERALGNAEKAEELYREARQVDPDHPMLQDQ